MSLTALLVTAQLKAMERNLRNALTRAHCSPDVGSQNVSIALRELGSYYDSQSQYEKALECYTENVAIWKKNQRDKSFRANREIVVRNLGNASHISFIC